MVCIQFMVKTKIDKNLESEGEGASLEIFNLLPLHTNSFYHLGGCRIHLPQLWPISSVEHYFPQFKSINKCKFVYIICTAD